jgi:hypothetical protein
MKELIKQVLRESKDMFNIHDKETSDFKMIDSVNMLYFQKLKSQGLGLYILTTNAGNIMSFVKVNNPTELKKFKNTGKRVDGFVINENTAEKFKKAVDKMNEIVKLKYESIRLLNLHLIGSLSEIIKNQK